MESKPGAWSERNVGSRRARLYDMEQRAQRRIYPKDTATWEAATIISRSKALRRQSTWTFSRSRPRRVSSWLVERGATRDTTYGHACTIEQYIRFIATYLRSRKHCHFTSRQPAHDQTHAAAVDVAFRSNATNGRYTRSDRVPLRVAVLLGNSAKYLCSYHLKPPGEDT
jgi:hypothetical protein